jgi:hypothetical protein
MNISPVDFVVRQARSFYQIVGNRRRFERAPVSGAIRATFSGCAVETVCVCSCVDISPRGIAIDCPEQMLPDMVIQLQSDNPGSRRLARVRYCHQRGATFRVGLEFIAS